MTSTHEQPLQSVRLPEMGTQRFLSRFPMGLFHIVLQSLVLVLTFVAVGHNDGNMAFMFYGPDGLTDNPGDAWRIDFFLILGFLAIVYGVFAGAYGRFLHFWEYARIACKGILISGVVHLAISALFVSAPVLLNEAIAWLVYGLATPAAGYLFRRFSYSSGLWTVNALIVGSESRAAQIHKAYANDPLLGYRIKGFVPIASKTTQTSLILNEEVLPILDVDLVALMDEDITALPHLLVAPNEDDMSTGKKLVNALSVNPSSFELIPPFGGLPLQGSTYSFFFGQDLLLIRGRNNLQGFAARFLKRLVDILGSATLITLLSPVFIILSLMVRRDGGAAFFSHNRVGRNDQAFGCYKFRSMRVDAEDVLHDILASDPAARAEWDATHKLKEDPRVTKTGEFLRKTSLDELPQLFNVLKGDMSLVGPRPIVTDEIEKYGDGFGFYKSVRPGITGLWQISGRSDVDYAFRVTLDEWYVRNWSLWADIVILLRTVPVVFGRGGAY